jgi:hypothetical protein
MCARHEVAIPPDGSAASQGGAREDGREHAPTRSDGLSSDEAVEWAQHCECEGSRRAVMTLKRYMPTGVRFFAHWYEPVGVSRADWHLREDSATVVLKEWELIPQYLQAQAITEICRTRGTFD